MHTRARTHTRYITRELLANPGGLSACALGGGGSSGGLDGKTGAHNVQTECCISMPLLGSKGTCYLVPTPSSSFYLRSR